MSRAAALIGSAARRAVAAWRAADAERRLAAAAALALFVSMFLPWYQRDTTAFVGGRPVSASESLSAFQVFTFVEAATLLVVAAVLALLFARAEQRDFHLPARDGTLVLAAGVWVCLLIFYRQLDQPEPLAGAQASASVGVNWGIFLAFLAALVMAAAGFRIRVAEAGMQRTPAVDRDEPEMWETPVREEPARPRQPGRGRPVTRDDAGQLSFDDPPEAPRPLAPGEVPRARDRR